jgi:hypothetical protein
MSLTLITPPTVEPLSVSDARDRLNLAVSDVSDTALTAFIKSARQKLERRYGVAMINQTWRLTLDRFPGWGQYPYPQDVGFYPSMHRDGRPDYGNRLQRFEIQINMAPIAPDGIQSVKYNDTDGSSQSMDPSLYSLVPGDLRSSLVLADQQTWPSTAFIAGAVQIQFVAGFGADDINVPESLKSAITLLVSHMRSLTTQNLFLSGDTVDGVGSKSYVVGGNAGAAIDAAVSSLMQDYVRPSL